MHTYSAAPGVFQSCILLFRASRPMSHCEDLFPLLQPTVFWLANGLELHHLLTHSCTPLPPPSFSSSSTDPLSTLHSILVYTFQQMFYTVSKVRMTLLHFSRSYVHVERWSLGKTLIIYITMCKHTYLLCTVSLKTAATITSLLHGAKFFSETIVS